MTTPPAKSPNDRLIFDVGLHIGQDTAYYLSKGFSVVAVEANPLLAQAAGERFAKEIAAGRLAVENVGISDRSGSAEFWICDDEYEWSSFDREVAARRGHKHHAIRIPCASIADLVDKHGLPRYMKIDIEGNDRICLKQLSPRKSPAYISIESYGEESIADLAALGYAAFKVVDQVCFRTLEDPPNFAYSTYWALKKFRDNSNFVRNAYVSRLAGKLGGRWLAAKGMDRYRMKDGYRFTVGSSGPFGEDTPGRWRSAEDAARALALFDRWMKTSGLEPVTRWFDVHARKEPAPA